MPFHTPGFETKVAVSIQGFAYGNGETGFQIFKGKILPEQRILNVSMRAIARMVQGRIESE